MDKFKPLDESTILARQTRDLYTERTITLAAGARIEINSVYDYFRVLSLTAGAGLSLIFGDNPNVTPFTGAGIGIKLSDIVTRLTLINTGGAPLTITFALALGVVNDDRLTVSGTLNVNVTNARIAVQLASNQINHGVVSVGTAATAIRNFNASRTSVTIKNESAVDVFLGTVGVTTANGMKLLPNESYSGNSFGAYQAIVASGTANVSYMEETN